MERLIAAGTVEDHIEPTVVMLWPGNRSQVQGCGHSMLEGLTGGNCLDAPRGEGLDHQEPDRAASDDSR